MAEDDQHHGRDDICTESTEGDAQTTNFLLFVKDEVMHLCTVLQQITAHLDNISTRDGVESRLKLNPRQVKELSYTYYIRDRMRLLSFLFLFSFFFVG